MARLPILLCLLFATLPILAQSVGIPAGAPSPPAVKEKAGNKSTVAWIWKSTKAGVDEKVFFRREFELPPNVATAVITVFCDDWHHLWVNGRDIGKAGEWTIPHHYDVLAHLKPDGRNVIAVESRNAAGPAGLALRFKATLKDGSALQIISDANWQCGSEAPEGWWNLSSPAVLAWPKAVVVAKMGEGPWLVQMPP
ncbi:MAG TPA: hypothetical protein VF258_00465 [Luteolibacter sp.]